MSYYTDYTLSVYSAVRDDSGALKMSDKIPSILEQQISDEIEKMNVFPDGDITDSYYVSTTWYDHEKDMRLLSTKFPDFVFWLSGNGDNCEDMWQKFFVGGQMQECYAQIVYDDFDPTKLEGEPVSDIPKRKYSYQIE